MKIRKFKVSKLYLKITLFFLLMVLFSNMILAFGSVWFSKQNEKHFVGQIHESMENISCTMEKNALSIIDLASMVVNNVLIVENFKPYDQLTSKNFYYYNAIITLLSQSRLQFNDVIDSIFLYSDEKRVLYATKEKGMAHLKVFFERFMNYETYDAEFWKNILQYENESVRILPADTFTTNRAKEQKTVIPLVYTARNNANTNILVINLSLEKIMKSYTNNQTLNNTIIQIYDEQKELLYGSTLDVDFLEATDEKRFKNKQGEYYVEKQKVPTLDIEIYGFTPVSAFLSFSAYFRFTSIALMVVYAISGLVFSFLLSKRTYAPIRQVSENIRDAQDEKRDMDPRPNNELEAIKDGINQLVSERRDYKLRNYQYSSHFMQQGFIALLERRTIDEEMDFKALLAKEYGFKNKKFCCASVIINVNENNQYVAEKEGMDYLKKALKEYLKAVLPFIQVQYKRNMLVLLLDVSEKSTTEYRKLFEQVTENFIDLPMYQLRIGVGESVQELTKVYDSFAQANDEIFVMPNKRTLLPSPQKSFAYDHKTLVYAANTCDVKHIKDVMENILLKAKQWGSTYVEGEAIVYDMVKTIKYIYRRLTVGEKVITNKLEGNLDPMEVLLLSIQINVTPLLSEILPYIPYKVSQNESASEEIAYKLKKLIDNNYMQELSLDILAEKINISAKHASRVFKQVMETNLTDYMAYVRVEKTKELLSTPMSLEEIAQRVGINNRTTFIRTFKKLEGTTPGEYRKRVQGKK